MYLMTEMANTIIGYEVKYANGIQFKQLFSQGIGGKKGTEGSEIVVTVSLQPSLINVKLHSLISYRVTTNFYLPHPLVT